ncbi:MAG TPA: hypothetical protein VIM71_12470 [Lacunisphaera sp.]
MHYRRLLLLLCLLLLPALAHAASREPFPGLGRKWRYYQSPNFELYSAATDGDSRDVLEGMELLRAMFLNSLQLKARLPQPVTIYYFDRQEDFDGYRPPHVRGGDATYLGFCTNFPDRTVIMLAPAQDKESAMEVVYHEYVHHLFRITEQNPAPWFNEGVAELFSTMQADREWLKLGQPAVGRVIELQRGRMMPFDALFAARYDSPLFKDSGHSGMFYAQSWAFLHYCYFGLNKIPPEKMSVFLSVAGSPEIQEHPGDFRMVCQELLGLDYAGLQREMERYTTRGKFMGRKAKRPTIVPQREYTLRPAGKEEMQIRLAELALRMADSPYANFAVREQLGRQPDARLHELMGSVALQAQEDDVAREHWRQAIELGTSNAAIFRELGRLEANAIFGQFNLDYRMPDQRAADLRHLLNKSLECAPEQSMGYEMLAWVEAMSGKPDIASLNRIQARFSTLNDRARTLLALAIVRMRLGQTADAAALLDKMEKLNPSDWVRYGVELTRARLEDRPVDPSKLPAPSAPGLRVAMPGINLPH